jgi:hypothetical protein
LSSSSLLRFATDDIRHSHLESGSVDCILDKGLLDALACCYEDAVTQERPVLRQRSQGKQYQKQYQRGTQGEREAVSEYARLLRRGGVVVVNSGRPRRSTLGPFGLEEEQDQEGENDQKESSTSSASSISRSNSRSKWGRWKLVEERCFQEGREVGEGGGGGGPGPGGVAWCGLYTICLC